MSPTAFAWVTCFSNTDYCHKRSRHKGIVKKRALGNHLSYTNNKNMN